VLKDDEHNGDPCGDCNGNQTHGTWENRRCETEVGMVGRRDRTRDGMPLKYVDLWGDIHYRDEEAITLLKRHEPPEGYYVAFSGGKDSVVIQDLVDRAGVKHDTHFHATTIDPPEVLQFIREYYPDVVWERPKNNMYNIIVKRGFPPTRQIRYCCSELKEIGGHKRTVVLGIRSEESNSRRQRKEYERSTVDKTKWFVNPILTWSTEDIWTYIRDNQLSYCSLYDNGYDRIGCILCPVQNIKGRIQDAHKFPKHYNAYLKAFDRMLKRHSDGEKEEYGWKTAEDVMYWWIYEKNRDTTTIQEQL
jgi:phosphoadenosine phosphosulfate reductase